MPARTIVISGRASAAIIAAELLLLLLVTWVYANMPGLPRETGPATITIQVGPSSSPPQSLARSHQI
jgi:hypothetical protein